MHDGGACQRTLSKQRPSPKLGSDTPIQASICFFLSILKVCRPVNSLLEEKVLEEEGDGVKPRRKYRTTKFDVADT